MITHTLITAAAFALALSSSQATVVVNFDADDTNPTKNFNDSQDLTADSSTGTANGTIFVAYQEVTTSSAGIQTHSAAGLRIRNGDTAGGTGTALFAFDLGGTYNLGTDSADAFDNFTIQSGGNLDRLDTGTGTRLSLENAGAWYVSEVVQVTGTTTDGNALDLNWYLVPDITTAGLDTIDGTIVNPNTFTSITMMGTYIHMVGKKDGTDNAASNYGVQTLVMNAIPEPGTYALLAGICALSFAMIRRRA